MNVFKNTLTSLRSKIQVVHTVGLQFSRSVSVSRLNTHTLDIGEGRSVAYQSIPGQRRPSIVMIPGLHSYTNMNGERASGLLRYCDMNDYPCVIYDHECSGQSKGNVAEITFTSWVEDALHVTNKLTDGPLVIVGSSLGGWLSIITALELKSRLHGLVLFSPALNYVWPYYHQHKALLPKDVRRRLEEGDPHVHTHEFGNALLKQDFALDSRKYEIDLEQKQKLDIVCPVRIIHGLNDTEVDPKQSLKLCESLASEDVDVIYRKTGSHQLESPHDLVLFHTTLDRLLKENPVK